MKLKNLGWLTWCSLGITAYTTTPASEIHFLSSGSHFYFGRSLQKHFSLNTGHRCAQRRGGCGYSLLMTLLARIIMMITITIVVISGSGASPAGGGGTRGQAAESLSKPAVAAAIRALSQG